MRIIDRILAGEQVSSLRHVPRAPVEAYRQAQAVQIDNVAEYVFRNVRVGDSWDLNVDFPNIAPPFELAWFEYRRPAAIPSLAALKPNTPEGVPGLPDHVGVLVEGQRTPEGWSTLFYIHSTWGREPVKGPITMRITCDSEGRSTGNGIAVLLNGNATDVENLSGALWAAGSDLLIPVLMATSLLHSKNVTIEREPAADARLLKAHRKRYGTDRVRFHLLHIEPMRKVLRDAGAESADTGVKQAMHMVRGHFKDYRDGRGLFGRFRGLYWWDQHIAGRLEEGLVKKEYVVHAPKGVVLT